jgi:hypothetical protein
MALLGGTGHALAGPAAAAEAATPTLPAAWPWEQALAAASEWSRCDAAARSWQCGTRDTAGLIAALQRALGPNARLWAGGVTLTFPHAGETWRVELHHLA